MIWLKKILSLKLPNILYKLGKEAPKNEGQKCSKPDRMGKLFLRVFSLFFLPNLERMLRYSLNFRDFA